MENATPSLIAVVLYSSLVSVREEPAATWVEPTTKMEFVFVPSGSFMMGSPVGEATEEDEDEQQHRVTLSKGFYIGKHEITKAEFEKFVYETGYKTEAEIEGFSYVSENGETVERPRTWRDTATDSHPVVHVSWNDATAFTGWLSEQTGQRLRLPTEAEWEYAARAGTTGAFPGDLDAIAWHVGNSGGEMHPVGRKDPNAWGLHDVIGNALEWVNDWYSEYPVADVVDPRSPSHGELKVIRSGTFGSDMEKSGRVADRHEAPPSTRGEFISFRVTREAP